MVFDIVTTDAPCHADLKARQRALRDGFPEDLGLRVHRALSWLGRAETEADDPDARFFVLVGIVFILVALSA